jgi:hypothetical protein
MKARGTSRLVPALTLGLSVPVAAQDASPPPTAGALPLEDPSIESEGAKDFAAESTENEERETDQADDGAAEIDMS